MVYICGSIASQNVAALAVVFLLHALISAEARGCCPAHTQIMLECFKIYCEIFSRWTGPGAACCNLLVQIPRNGNQAQSLSSFANTSFSSSFSFFDRSSPWWSHTNPLVRCHSVMLSLFWRGVKTNGACKTSKHRLNLSVVFTASTYFDQLVMHWSPFPYFVVKSSHSDMQKDDVDTVWLLYDQNIKISLNGSGKISKYIEISFKHLSMLADKPGFHQASNPLYITNPPGKLACWTPNLHLKVAGFLLFMPETNIWFYHFDDFCPAALLRSLRMQLDATIIHTEWC